MRLQRTNQANVLFHGFEQHACRVDGSAGRVP